MKITTKFVLGLLLVLISVVSMADFIFRPGHPVTFDGHVHMTTMNQFAQALKDGEFPVTWSNNFANYGLPLPLIAHQVPAYLGAFLILLGVSTETAFLILLTFGVIVSGILFFLFFRNFADEKVAFTATLLATFFPYRALNIYTRGGLPEILSMIFLPILFWGVLHLQNKKFFKGALFLTLSIFFLSLTHPMMLLVFSISLGIYFISGLTKKSWQDQVLIGLVSVVAGALGASYYLIPLLLEMKYFHQGFNTSEVSLDKFISFKQLFDPSWFYTYTHPGPRGNYVKLGLFEFITFLSSVGLLVYSKTIMIKKYLKRKAVKQLLVWTIMSAVSILLLLPISYFIYKLPIISQIQYPWRFLNVLQFLIPGLFVMLMVSFPKLNNNKLLLLIITLVLWFRLPQFYGKNYILQDESDYEFNQANLHSVNMNTVWSSNSEDYEVKDVQAEIIEGEGLIEFQELKNASRKYIVDAQTDVRIADYTFFFPEWRVYVDNEPVVVQFQDPSYRGFLTYEVPVGKHEIVVRYEHTNVRKYSYLISLLGFIAIPVFLIIVKKKWPK